MLRAVLCVLCLAAGTVWPAAPFDLARLMQVLAEAPAGEVSYEEKKTSALLAEPVVSSGTLAYRRPDVVEKNMLLPRRESFRIAGRELTITRKGAEKRIAIASEPLLAAFAASLRGVLSGDAALLSEYFQLVLAGSEAEWALEMTPRDEAVQRYLERVVVTGRAGRVGVIEVREASGDRSVLTVRQSPP